MASPKLKIVPSTIWTVIWLWISYAKEKWYWAFLVLFYKLGEDALLGWINNQWGVAMTYLNYGSSRTRVGRLLGAESV